MRETTSFVAAVIVSLGLCSSVSAEVVALKDLEQRALEHHSLLQAGAARERAAAATVREAESAYKPRIGINVDSNVAPGRRIVTVVDNQERQAQVVGFPSLNGPGSGRAFLPQWRTIANLALQANIYDFGRTQAAVSASRAKHESTKVEHDVTKAQIVSSVRIAYLTWLSAHQMGQLTATATQDGARRSERVKSLVQEGARPRAELAPVEADRLLSELELERALGDLDSAALMLEQAVGEPLTASAEPDLSVLDVAPPATEAEPRADPALRMLVHQRAALEATARMHRKEGMPMLTASAAAGIGGQIDMKDGTAKAFPNYIVGLGLTVPLWDGGGNKAAADATEAQADELRLRLESTESEREHERKRARLDAEHAEKRQHTAEQLLEVCSTRVTDVEAGYELGATQFDQVQQARAQLRRAQTELVLARVARAEAILRFAP